MSDTHLSDTTFASLDIHPIIQQGIQQAGFEYCTPIQAMALPVALQGKDVSGQAQTGTGKTAAFLIAALHHLLRDSAADEAVETEQKNPIRAMIIAPTRELAIQIHEDAKPLIKQTELKMALAYGGTDYDKQKAKIEAGVDLLIGTPGRIIDYFKQRVFSLDALEVIVLDEADRMFDLGFIADIRYLFRRMPEPAKRLNLLFSATLSRRVAELAYEHMDEPTEVKVESETLTADKVSEIGFMPSNEEKIPLLLGILGQADAEKSVVFVNTKIVAETLQAWMLANDFKSSLLSGDVPQKKRERLLNDFKTGKTNVLVATDVAARGLHIPDVSTVINYDLPNDAEDYVHRIGRTARAGESGTAVSLICETYAMNMMDIETYTGKSIPVEKAYDTILAKDLKEPDLTEIKNKWRRDKPGKGGRNSRERNDSSERNNSRERNENRERKVDQRQDHPEDRTSERKHRKAKHSDTQGSQNNGHRSEAVDIETIRQQIESIQQRAKKFGREIPAVG